MDDSITCLQCLYRSDNIHYTDTPNCKDHREKRILIPPRGEKRKDEGGRHVVTRAINAAISGLFAGVGFMFSKVIVRSLTDATRSWGIIGMVLFVLFSWTVTWVMYITYDLMHAVCSVIVILCMHIAFWCIGYFSHN